MLTADDFDDFFAAVRGGASGVRPYPWQRALLERVLATGRWPGRVVAPTGAGKTSVIDVHVFANALAAADAGIRPPRRLAMVVDRRVLVDDQYEHARHLSDVIKDAKDGVLAEVQQALVAARGDVKSGGRSVVVARLRGGAIPERSWLDDPTSVSVICATPDMWGSRLLFRGYGSSSRAWPREAGLLAYDSVVVVDEAHLARQLVVTARRVSAIAGVGDRPNLPSCAPLQVVETTATPGSEGVTGDVGRDDLGVGSADLADSALAARLTRPKPFSYRPVDGWSVPSRTPKVAMLMADEVVALVERSAALRAQAIGSVGCFVNSVRRAVAVATVLSRREVDGRPLRVATVCGQVRPADLAQLRRAHGGLLTVEGDASVDVLVTTQSLEVGVDLDLIGIVSELPAASALTQRAGRVNRRGLRDCGEVVVVGPAGGLDDPTSAIGDNDRSGPYPAEDLRASLAWLASLPRLDDHTERRDLNPLTLMASPPPVATPRRALYQRPELADAWLWSRTSDALATEIDLRLWLADDLDADLSVGLVVRDQLPVESADAVELVRDLPPQDHEIFSLPIRDLSACLVDLRLRQKDTELDLPRTVVCRAGEVLELEWTDADDPRPRVRPGDVVVVDARARMFTPRSAGTTSPQVPATAADVGDALATAPDVLVPQVEDVVRDTGGRDVGRLEPSDEGAWAQHGWASLRAAVDGADDDPRQLQDAVVSWLLSTDAPSNVRMSERLVRAARDSKVEVIAHRSTTDGELTRVVVRSTSRAIHDEERRQEWTPGTRTHAGVQLDVHQVAVGRRAAELASRLSLGDEIVEVMRVAGEHHDDGKRDARFQRRLGALDEGPVLAKSPRARRWQSRSGTVDDRSGLPAGWRHEQLSVAAAWNQISSLASVDRDLVARLIGTTHGRGRAGFPHTSDGLLQDADDETAAAARELFDEGEWDELVERTQLGYGPWLCAYLEAVLRAADGQVSMEGS